MKNIKKEKRKYPFYPTKNSCLRSLIKEKIVNLEKYGLPPALLRKSDGATLYLTRDIAAALYRQKTYKFDKMLYEVGGEQRLHFQQLFKVLELLGYTWTKDCIHIDHGLYLGDDGKKFSTRKGKTIFMTDVLDETIALAKKIVQEKNPKLTNKDAVAKAVGVGAIIFGDLNDPHSKVSKASKQSHGYHVLEELNVRPAITYLAKIRNPHPKLEKFKI